MDDFEKLGVFYLGREFDPAASADAPPPGPLLYDSKDLTTHAVCVGMTGSGKTGLCISLLEEAAIDGIPAIVIDPKGDIANILLAFPDLRPEDFAPWVDPAEAARKGVPAAEWPGRVADIWRKGLAESGQDGARIRRFRDAVDIAVYTPGSDACLQLSVLRSLAAPEGALDAAALRERVSGVVSGLLGLVGVPADPLKSREHILLCAILEASWREDRALDLAGLIGAIQKPPFDKVGVFDLETFFPAKDRLGLAMAVNNLLASPGFGAWLEGEPLDIQRLLHTPEGKPRISIVSIAHLGDSERMFVVTLLLNELVAWMRGQPGTSSLRALFYMDEIFGYFPPTAMPPSKLPMLTLLKQARAYGLGLVLATQNPVDLDYKGLANAGTWFIGRLQTERDKERVIEGLQGALAGSALDRPALERLMSGLGQRVFLMRNVHDDDPVLFRTRFALSYLRGPLTLPEIGRLMAPRKAAAPAGRPAASAAVTAVTAAPRPALQAGIEEIFLPATPGRGPVTYRPRVGAAVRLHYVDARSGLDAWRNLALLAPVGEDGRPAWDEATELASLGSGGTPVDGAGFADVPAALLRAPTYAAAGKSLAAHLLEHGSLELLRCAPLKLASQPGETEGDFRARLAHALHEKRDEEVAKLRQKHAAKLRTLEDQVRRAEERAERERAQYSQRKLDSAVALGASVLGAIFGGRRSAASRAGTAARSAGRAYSEKGDVARADENLGVLRQRRDEQLAAIEAEAAALAAGLDASGIELERIRVAPRKSDIAVGRVLLAWEPWRVAADGLPQPAWQPA
ncbi:MAG: DUF87 domain-containing protein [Steroidobacteraceae bacterium]|jgi:hypothetical protein|nr:DUF87 domain-containing protein [Steroidobacteraceae bacterium]